MALADGLAQKIEHTLLRPEATKDRIVRLIEEAKRYGFGAVVVNGGYAALAKGMLQKGPIRLVVTVAFPFGAAHTKAKVKEALLAAVDGADDIDMVMDVGRFKSGDEAYTQSEVRAVKGALKRLSNRLGREVSLKVIIETPLLMPDEIRRASLLCAEAGADFIKTSTGFGPRPTSLEDVRLIKEAVAGSVPIKAAGGIRTYEQAIAFLEAGALRLGTSSSVAILEGVD